MNTNRRRYECQLILRTSPRVFRFEDSHWRAAMKTKAPARIAHPAGANRSVNSEQVLLTESCYRGRGA